MKWADYWYDLPGAVEGSIRSTRLWFTCQPSLRSIPAIRALEMLILWRGAPKRLRMDNGPELISKELAGWAAKREIRLDHIQPGKPAQNAYIEHFNRTYCEDMPDAYLFTSIEEVQEITEQWLEEYNALRPPAALGNVPPYQYAPNPA